VTRETAKAGIVGQITSGIDQDTLVLKTINFVRHQLPAWRDDPYRPIEQSEHKLNPQLCKFLDARARNIFWMVRFDYEEPQSGRRSVDLSASPAKAIVFGARCYTIYDPILVLECKRLPAPSKDREKEYVTGGKGRTSGGIQRFKLGLHGADLDLVAMIGYLQEQSALYWHGRINKWISELSVGKITDESVWNDDETLEPLVEDVSRGLARCQSVHGRTGSKSNKIRIHHLWIAMDTVRTQKSHD